MKPSFRLAATAVAFLAGVALAAQGAAEEPRDSSHPPHGAAPHGPPPRAQQGHGPLVGGHGPLNADVRFDRRSNPQQWRSARNDWRGAHPIRNAPWRGNREWWRGRPEFRGYEGVRVGFWFAPGFGYLTLPPAYRGHHWGAGEYIPALFWEYRVANWTAYGLEPPPFGCAWIWIDGGVALVDLSDGYVLDVEYDVY
jgi:Ni/Co efflux regulator RcnB